MKRKSLPRDWLPSSSLFLTFFAVFFAVGFASSFFVQRYFYPKNEFLKTLNESSVEKENLHFPAAKYWFYHSASWMNIFESVDVVLERLGLEWIPMNATSNATVHNDWDLLWSYNHHTIIPLDWNQIRYHQKINHIPGNQCLISKSLLGSTTDSKYVPKAFLNIDDVKKYTKTHPDKRFVVKLKTNRGVVLQHVSEMNFTNTDSYNDYFAMEFVEDPLLFNGHKFDFAVYVIITSINPLRLYYYNKNIIMRFCPKTYNTSDPEDRDSYVVKSSHIPGSKFPGIKKYFENGYTYKEGFNAFLKSKGPDTEEKVWNDVEDLIRSVVVSKEKFFIEEVSLISINNTTSPWRHLYQN